MPLTLGECKDTFACGKVGTGVLTLLGAACALVAARSSRSPRAFRKRASEQAVAHAPANQTEGVGLLHVDQRQTAQEDRAQPKLIANPCEGIRGHTLQKRTVYITDEVFAPVYANANSQLRDTMDVAYLTEQRQRRAPDDIALHCPQPPHHHTAKNRAAAPE